MRLLALLILFLPFVALADGPSIGLYMDEGHGPSTIQSDDRPGFYCDMTSNVCSDGREIQTVSATDRPCEKEKGVWSYVGPDEACFNWRGELEAWSTTTTYLSYGSDLSKDPWGPSVRGGSMEPLSDGWRIYKDPETPLSGWQQRGPGGSGEAWTSSYILRTVEPVYLSLYAGTSQSCGGVENFDTEGEWRIISCTREISSPSSAAAMIYPGGNQTGIEARIDAKAAWLVKGEYRRRPCWADDEAPITCDAERHLISTEGWPTEEGEVCITATIGQNDTVQVLIEGRQPSGANGPDLYVGTNGTVVVVSDDVSYATPLTVTRDKPSTFCMGRKEGRLTARLDGEQAVGSAAPPFTWAARASIGRGRVSQYQGVNGSISHLSVRSYD